MKTKLLVLSFIACLGFTNPESNLKIGQRVPDISLQNTKEEIVALSSLKGKVVLIQFWASWCKVCKENINTSLLPLYGKYKSKGLEIYGVSLDTDKNSWTNAAEKPGAQWINVSDLKGAKSNAISQYNVANVPTSFLINKKGELVAVNLTNEALESKITELLN